MVEVNVILAVVIVRPVVCGLLKLKLDAMYRCVTVSTGFLQLISQLRDVAFCGRYISSLPSKYVQNDILLMQHPSCLNIKSTTGYRKSRLSSCNKVHRCVVHETVHEIRHFAPRIYGPPYMLIIPVLEPVNSPQYQQIPMCKLSSTVRVYIHQCKQGTTYAR